MVSHMYKLKHGTVTYQLIPRDKTQRPVNQYIRTNLRIQPHTKQYGELLQLTNNNELLVITYNFQCPHATFGCLNML